jgi:hypothetical protein
MVAVADAQVDVRERAHGVGRRVADYLAKAPGTHILLLIVMITTLMQRGLDETTATRVLRQASTNLVHMTRDAPRVLFLSAFLLDHGHLLVEVVLFTLVMVPVERWIGTYRWMGVFAAGHVGATLATTVGIWLQVRSGSAGSNLVYPVDVGVSYGLYAVAAVLPRRLPRPADVIVLGIIVGLALRGVVMSGTFTDWGHAAAVAIGLALAPLVAPRRREAARPRHRSSSAFMNAWYWLSTPPDRPHWSEARQQRAAGIVALVLAVGILGVLVWNGDSDLALPARTTRLQATVTEPRVPCGTGCTDAVVRYTVNGAVLRETVRLPPGTTVQRGERLAVDIDPAIPAVARLPRPAQRVNVDGLLGATAVALALAAIGLLMHARRLASNA